MVCLLKRLTHRNKAAEVAIRLQRFCHCAPAQGSVHVLRLECGELKSAAPGLIRGAYERSTNFRCSFIGILPDQRVDRSGSVLLCKPELLQLLFSPFGSACRQ